jgi:2-methylcitrate synthase/citrate synthase II
MVTASPATPVPTAKPVDTRGLANQVIGETKICAVTQTELIYRGYEIADLAEKATFEGVAHLVLIGTKPTDAELAAFSNEVKGMRAVQKTVIDQLAAVVKAAPTAHPMSLLRTGVSILGHHDAECESNAPDAEMRKSKRLLAQIPTLIGAIQRTIENKPVLEPDASLGHAANLMWLMTGKKPSELEARIMDVSLILYAEHDFNASTFTCRCIASTESDMHSAVCGGIGALKGPLHGGANEMAMEMLKDLDTDCAGGKMTTDAWMQRAFAEKRKLMGFGHRVYKNGDHRAGILRRWGLKLAEQMGPSGKKWFDMGDEVQAIMLRDKNIHPNVDFPCGMTYFIMGIPVPQYTPIFVAARITGWCAHIMEQHQNNRIIRPLAEYQGAMNLKW